MKWKYQNLKHKLRGTFETHRVIPTSSQTAISYHNAGWLRRGWCVPRAWSDLAPEFPPDTSVAALWSTRSLSLKVPLTTHETKGTNTTPKSSRWGFLFFPSSFLKAQIIGSIPETSGEAAHFLWKRTEKPDNLRVLGHLPPCRFLGHAQSCTTPSDVKMALFPQTCSKNFKYLKNVVKPWKMTAVK